MRNREFVLNHASVQLSNTRQALRYLVDVCHGMHQLIKQNCATGTIRASKYLREIKVNSAHSFRTLVLELGRNGWHSEQRLLMRLTTRSPLYRDLDERFTDRFLGCDPRVDPDTGGEPLVLCSLTNGISFGFPTTKIWDQDHIEVSYIELLDTGEESSIREGTVDNLTRSIHSEPILDRHRSRLIKEIGQSNSKIEDLLSLGSQVFPHLRFGLDLERCLSKIDNRSLDLIISKLDCLDSSIREWKCRRTPRPHWKCKVSSESLTVQSDPRLYRARIHRSVSGRKHEFLMHARYGRSGRIHFRVVDNEFILEIGYIGHHLPL